MDRNTYVTLAGREYPLNFSTRASIEIKKKFGGVEELGQKMMGGDVAEALETLTWLLDVLLRQGAAYHRIATGEALETPSAEDLEVIVGIDSVAELTEAVLNALQGGARREVEVEEKNREATPLP